MLKRTIPFILTFTLGLAIASIFVSIVPSVNFKRTDRGCKHRSEQQVISDLQRENGQLRLENNKLNAEQLYDMDSPMRFEDLDELDNVMTPPMPIEPRRNR
jgi:hypothetical protein